MNKSAAFFSAGAMLLTLAACSTNPPRSTAPVLDASTYSEGARMALAFGLVNEEQLKTTITDMEKAKKVAASRDAVNKGMDAMSVGMGLITGSPGLIFLGLPTPPAEVDHPLYHNALIQQLPKGTSDLEPVALEYGEKYYNAALPFLIDAGVKIHEGHPVLTSTPFTRHDEDGFAISIDSEFAKTCWGKGYPACNWMYFNGQSGARFVDTANTTYAIWHRTGAFSLTEAVAGEISTKVSGFIY